MLLHTHITRLKASLLCRAPDHRQKKFGGRHTISIASYLRAMLTWFEGSGGCGFACAAFMDKDTRKRTSSPGDENTSLIELVDWARSYLFCLVAAVLGSFTVCCGFD